MKETDNLLRLSPPKKQKLGHIMRLLGDPSGRRCIDLGGDNGVISLFLRKSGGEWTSADLDEETVRSIRELVGNSVIRTDGSSLPFMDGFFDAAVIVDFLEHIENDGALIAELSRVLKPGGSLIINVPLPREGSFLSALRKFAGYTDEKHGHVRPGYNPADIASLLGNDFSIEECLTYIGFFTELTDTLANIILFRASKGNPGRKGNVITREKAEKHKGVMRLLPAVFLLMEGFSALDALLPAAPGASLILKAVKA